MDETQTGLVAIRKAPGLAWLENYFLGKLNVFVDILSHRWRYQSNSPSLAIFGMRRSRGLLKFSSEHVIDPWLHYVVVPCNPCWTRFFAGFLYKNDLQYLPLFNLVVWHFVLVDRANVKIYNYIKLCFFEVSGSLHTCILDFVFQSRVITHILFVATSKYALFQ